MKGNKQKVVVTGRIFFLGKFPYKSHVSLRLTERR
jgi:hypothetical protein